MDLEYPFSEAFGPASTRDELIASAQHVYHRLLNLAPGSKVLPSVILSAVADNGDGTVDNSKRRSLRNLFRPDADKEVQLLAFIQSCDSVYKKLRFFRASVGNSSVIDKVLESIIDAIYGFTLGLVILSLLNFNPWPLLVSMSTLMVTFAFAVGPSAAKSIEVSQLALYWSLLL
jgi:small-conductance mechanosensitive channel